MDTLQARQLVADAGRMLLSEGLVARTWGNVSCRTGESAFVITPSGLGYEHMTADDVVAFDMTDNSFAGTRKPSSEWGVHAAAYARFPDAQFVIHTHQTYATALGLAGFDARAFPEAALAALGGVALAGYGLPGTKRLREQVSAALASGAHTALMAHHGVLIAGRDLDEAFSRAKLLESLCRAACKGQPAPADTDAATLESLARQAAAAVGSVSFTAAPAVKAASGLGGALIAQLDDMAQMIGRSLVVVPPEAKALTAAMQKHDAALVSGLGAVCCAKTEGDRAALLLLIEKACVCDLHTRACGVSGRLSLPDTLLMRFVYKQKYARKIGG